MAYVDRRADEPQLLEHTYATRGPLIRESLMRIINDRVETRSSAAHRGYSGDSNCGDSQAIQSTSTGGATRLPGKLSAENSSNTKLSPQ